MRKTLFLLLTSGLLAAQNPELFNNNWYISQIVIGSQTFTSPMMQVPIGQSTFTNIGSPSFNSAYYNTATSSIIYSTLTDSFIRNGGGCTLAIYNGTNASAAQAFDQQNCDFFFNNASGVAFNYQIINNGSSKTLIITNNNTGNKVYYNNFFLNTKESDSVKKLVSVYPNPVKELLTIENIEKNLAVKIYDLSGKLILEKKSDNKKIMLETGILQKGQYILVVEKHQPYIFIKE